MTDPTTTAQATVLTEAELDNAFALLWNLSEPSANSTIAAIVSHIDALTEQVRVLPRPPRPGCAGGEWGVSTARDHMVILRLKGYGEYGSWDTPVTTRKDAEAIYQQTVESIKDAHRESVTENMHAEDVEVVLPGAFGMAYSSLNDVDGVWLVQIVQRIAADSLKQEPPQ